MVAKGSIDYFIEICFFSYNSRIKKYSNADSFQIKNFQQKSGNSEKVAKSYFNLHLVRNHYLKRGSALDFKNTATMRFGKVM